MTDMVYKIRNKNGLYSCGGCKPKFNKIGKTWSKLSEIKLHLRLFNPKPYKYTEPSIYHKAKTNNIPVDWEIVEFIPSGKTINAKSIFGDEM